MRRFLAVLVTFAMLFACAAGTLAVGEQSNASSVSDEAVSIGVFRADTFSIVIGETSEVTFSVKLAAKHQLAKTSVCVFDDSGAFITYLSDDGRNGDEKAFDGKYTGVAQLSSDSVGKVHYHVEVNGVATGDHQISFRKEVTDVDWANSDKIWDKVDRLVKQLEAMEADEKTIVDTVYTHLTTEEHVAALRYDSELTISFEFDSGIPNIFARYTEDQKSGVGQVDYAAQIEEALRDASDDFILEGKIGVYCPYYGYDSNFNYCYLNRAEQMGEVTGYEVDSYYGSHASVNSFKNFDQYGIIMVDSHGADTNGGGYICIPAPGDYDQQDVVEGHLVQSYGDVYLTGTFFQKYCEELPNTIVYIGICYGMAAPNLSSPLIAHGAGYVCGYDDSVSFTYDNAVMDTFGEYLVATNPETDDMYTAGEAFAKTVQIESGVDPYGDARFIHVGNDDIRAIADQIAIETVVLDPSELTMYSNNFYQINIVTQPVNANRYKVEWSSSDESVVKVDEKGMTQAIGDGTAVVTATIKDYIVADAPETYIATCNITVDGYMNVTGITADETITIYSGAAPEKLNAAVVPFNASNQTILYSSSDESIATVDEDGYLTALHGGIVIITMTTEEGGFTTRTICNITAADFDTAANEVGGGYEFATDAQRPWEVVFIDDRIAVQSTNHSSNSRTMAWFTVEDLPQGAVLSFDWKVSSEANYDFLTFKVNNQPVGSINEISGQSSNWTTKRYTAPVEGRYTFSWTYSKDSGADDYEDCGYIDNIDITYDGQTHTVTFMDMDNTTVLSEQTVAHGEGVTAPTVPTHDGYTFLGWSGQFTQVRCDMTINAIFMSEGIEPTPTPTPTATPTPTPTPTPIPTPTQEPPIGTFTVTFVDWDDTVLAEVEVEAGNDAEAPADPVREGYVFAGWDSDFTNVTEDRTIKATYRAMGDANGDDLVNTGDAVTVLKYCVDEITFDDLHKLLADFNGDGNVNTGDAVSLLVYCVEQ